MFSDTLARTADGAPMRLPIYQLDAFTDRMFGGNPAAVCLLDGWLDDATPLPGDPELAR